MKLFIVGGNSPTGKGLIEILRKNKVRFLAPADKHFLPENAVAIAKMVTDYSPSQLINAADFISRNHSALKRAESAEQRCEQIANWLGLVAHPRRDELSRQSLARARERTAGELGEQRPPPARGGGTSHCSRLTGRRLSAPTGTSIVTPSSTVPGAKL